MQKKVQENNIAEIFRQVSRLLNRVTYGSYEEYDAICKLFVNQLELDNFSLLINNSNDSERETQFSYKKGETTSSDSEIAFIKFIGKFILKHSSETQLIHQSDLAKIKEQKHLHGNSLPQQFLGVPLINQGNVMGIICTHSNEKNVHLIEYQKLLEDIAPILCLFINQNQEKTSLTSQTARLHAIFESSSDLIWSVNKELELISFNQNYFDAIFHKHDGETVSEHTKDGQVIEMPYLDFWNKKYKKSFEGNALNFEIQLKGNNGKLVWKEIFLNPIYLASGQIEEVSGIAHDISDKKQSQLALTENEEKFRNIFESFQDLYVRCDLKGRITMVSPSSKDMIGYTEKQVLGKNITNYYLYTTKTKNLVKKILQSGSIRNFEISLTSKNGKIIPCICNIRMVYDKKKKPIGLESVCRDITKLVKTNEELLSAKELAEASLKVKEQFLANMSHEIRTPMNGIIGMMDMLAETDLDNLQTTYLDTIKQSSDLLLNLLNDIIDLSKVRSGKLKLSKTNIPVSDMLNKVCTLFSAEAAKKNISLALDIDHSVPEYIIADQTRLLQIFSNLISNAIKFTNERGEVTLSLSSTRLNSAKIKLKAQIIDNGIGIKKEHIKRLFSSFSQVDDSFSKLYQGAGLGLAITKDLVELLKGEIGVASEYGEGSTFWFTFEAKKSSKPNTTESGRSTRNKTKVKSKIPTVLLVDDNEINRTVGNEILTKAGVEVVVAVNGFDAIEQVSSHSFDLIFMDIQLPEINGIDTMKRIRKLKSGHCPPIIAMTAFSDDSEITSFIKKGFNDYQPKPIKAHEFIDKVEKWTSSDKKPADLVHRMTETNSSPKVVNMDTLQQLEKYSDSDTVVTSLQEFDEETTNQIKACEGLISKKDYDTLGGHIHTIKGNSGTLGADKVYALAAEIEKNMRKGQFSSLHEDLKSLYLVFIEFKKEVSNELNIVFDG